jgi:hypothetical protein
MPGTENAPRQLVLKSGSTTLTLVKDPGTATLRRKFLMWNLKPAEMPPSEVARVTIDAAVDRASGVEVFHTMLVMRTGKGLGISGRECARRADEGRCNTGLSWIDRLMRCGCGLPPTPHGTPSTGRLKMRQTVCLPGFACCYDRARTSWEMKREFITCSVARRRLGRSVRGLSSWASCHRLSGRGRGRGFGFGLEGLDCRLCPATTE